MPQANLRHSLLSIVTSKPFVTTIAVAILTWHMAVGANAQESRPGAREGKRERPVLRATRGPGVDVLPEEVPFEPWDGDVIDESEANIVVICWGTTDTALQHLIGRIKVTPQHDPAEAASTMQSIPDGQRVLFLRKFAEALVTDPRDVCLTPAGHPTNQRGIWPQRGLEATRFNVERFCQQFKEAGGDVNYVILDFEKGYRWPAIYKGGSERRRAIQNDPRFSSIATQLGYSDLSDVTGARRLRWDAVMAGHRSFYMNQAFTDVVKEYFPEAIISNYQSFLIDEEHAVPHYAGRMEYRLGDGFGTHDAAKFYGIIKPGLARLRLDGTHPYGDSPFAGVLLYVNQMRAIRRSSDRPFHPWIVGYSQIRSSAVHLDRNMVISKSPHYDEFVFQIGIHGCREIICWNLKESTTNRPGSYALPSDDVRLSSLLEEMNFKLAGEWGATVSIDPIPWDSKIIATGLHVDDRIVWRISVDEGIETVQVRIGNVVKELTPEPNRRGLWVEHPADQSLTIVRVN